MTPPIQTILTKRLKMKNTVLNKQIVSKPFPYHLMEKAGLLRYAAKIGVTAITIVFDADDGTGWLTSISSSPIPIDPPDSY